MYSKIAIPLLIFLPMTTHLLYFSYLINYRFFYNKRVLVYSMSVDILKGERKMKPLSESTYLVLLALYQEPLHGYGII